MIQNFLIEFAHDASRSGQCFRGTGFVSVLFHHFFPLGPVGSKPSDQMVLLNFVRDNRIHPGGATNGPNQVLRPVRPRPAERPHRALLRDLVDLS